MKRIIKSWTITGLILPVVCVLGAGCLGPGSGGITVESYPSQSIKVHSKIFQDYFEVASVSTAQKNGLLTVTIALDNQKEECQFEYRYRWLDGSGIEVNTGMSIWIQEYSSAKERRLLTGIAPSKGTKDFILDMRFRQTSERWE